jgi:hypothetical protein
MEKTNGSEMPKSQNSTGSQPTIGESFELIGRIGFITINLKKLWHSLQDKRIDIPARPAATIGSVAIAACLGSSLYFWPPRETAIQEIFYAFYGDMDQNGKTRFKQETVTLSHSEQSTEIHGKAVGPVTDPSGIQREATWVLDGHRSDDHLVLAETSKSEGSRQFRTAAATYYLRKLRKSYTGLITYWDRCFNRVVQCPVVFSDLQLSEAIARDTWPKAFSMECKRVDLTPDSGITIADLSPTTCPAH